MNYVPYSIHMIHRYNYSDYIKFGYKFGVFYNNLQIQFITSSKGPRSSLCTQVPCLAVKKWNRSIITESNIFYKCIIPIIRKEYA